MNTEKKNNWKALLGCSFFLTWLLLFLVVILFSLAYLVFIMLLFFCHSKHYTLYTAMTLAFFYLFKLILMIWLSLHRSVKIPTNFRFQNWFPIIIINSSKKCLARVPKKNTTLTHIVWQIISLSMYSINGTSFCGKQRHHSNHSHLTKNWLFFFYSRITCFVIMSIASTRLNR